MPRTPHSKDDGPVPDRERWAYLLLGGSVVVMLSAMLPAGSTDWLFALTVSLFPVPLVGLARRRLGATLWALALVFVAPAVGVLLLPLLHGSDVQAKFAATALLMLAGFWLVPLAATTLLYSRTFPRCITERRMNPPADGKET